MANDLQSLDTPIVPTFPTPRSVFEQKIADQHNGMLRNFMLKLTSSLRALFGPNGGQYVDMPNGLFFCTDDQSLAAINTAYAVEFPVTYLSNAVQVNAGTESRIYTAVAGVYNFQFSGQLRSSSASSKQVFIWIVRNGINIGYSTHQYTVAGSDTHLNISWNFNIDMQAGDYLEMEWAADSTDVTLESTAATSPHPGIPAAVMSVTFMAPLPDVIPTPP